MFLDFTFSSAMLDEKLALQGAATPGSAPKKGAGTLLLRSRAQYGELLLPPPVLLAFASGLGGVGGGVVLLPRKPRPPPPPQPTQLPHLRLTVCSTTDGLIPSAGTYGYFCTARLHCRGYAGRPKLKLKVCGKKRRKVSCQKQSIKGNSSLLRAKRHSQLLERNLPPAKR